MNVLVYSGPGATTESVKHCIESLRLHLSPYYAVVSLTEASMLKDPWMHKTALLVMPGGSDLPYCNSLDGEGNRKIRQYVRNGGRFLGICAGAYYAGSRCEFEVGDPNLEVSGPRELGFYPGTVRGCAFKGFVYESHKGSRAARLNVNTDLLPGSPAQVRNYYNGGGVFMDASRQRNVEVLATYAEDIDVDDQEKAAAVYCKVGKGEVVLTGTHPEFTPGLIKIAAEDETSEQMVQELADHNQGRKKFIMACLSKLGLRVNPDVNTTIPRITPLFLTSKLQPTNTTTLMRTLHEKLDFTNGNTLEDDNDTFVFHTDEVDDDHTYFLDEANTQDPNAVTKHVKVFTGGNLPDSKSTPYFNLGTYYSHLSELYGDNIGRFGCITGYGEVVSSTNTLMDSNPNLLAQLPTGTVLTATAQVAGRGRGGNVWINPKGVMASSVLFRLPAQSTSQVVTLQYLCGLALIESILGYSSTKPGVGVGYEDLPVKLKWPNDIYILKPDYFNKVSDKDSHTAATVDGDDEMWAKVSGAIINSQFINGQFHLVWGGGVNVSNDAPTTSLNIVLRKLNAIRAQHNLAPLPDYQPEILLAKLMHTMNSFYDVFLKSGLTPFLPLYYKRWLHSDQLVRVDEGKGRIRTCRIKGITEDYGLLIAHDTTSTEVLHLQPDGNSFDIFKGLVYRK